MKHDAIQNAVQKIIEPNWKNKTLFLGDNLRIMRRMNSGLMDLIYLDPPFNSNRKYKQPIGDGGMREVFKDIWRETDLDQAEHALLAKDHRSLYHAITASRAAHGGAMFSYLLMMSSRLIEMRRLLKETGSIYLHCDPTASHYLKMIMDAIFGHKNFRNEIIWGYPASPSAAKKDFPRKHDTILRYSNWTFNADDVRIPYSASSLHRVKYAANASKVMAGTEIKLQEKGKIPPTIWVDIQQAYRYRSEISGYPTQKPTPLLERIIQASSNEGDWVFDPFCGCATTLVAAEKLGREWVGIDVSPQSAKEIKKRMIKLAIDRGEDELAIWQGIHNRDLRTAKQLDRLDRTEWGKLPPYRTHKKRLFGEQKGRCAACGNNPGYENMDVDHIVPKSKGGTDHLSNLQLLCAGCNRKKGDRPQAYLDAQLERLGITLH